MSGCFGFYIIYVHMLVHIKRRCSLVRAINEHGTMVEKRVRE
jgi:hypothetical protein